MAREWRYASIQAIKDANRRAGETWFSLETMRFFNSRVHGRVIAGRFFVTSEDSFDRSERRYTVREALPSGRIQTVGEFLEHETLQRAVDTAWAIANEQDGVLS